MVSRFSTPAPGWVNGENEWFKRERSLETTGEAVVVRDSFTNLTGEPLAVMRHNEITLGERMKHLWLGGLERADRTGYSTSPANPTTFAATTSAGIGLLPVDDIARVHVVNQADGDVAGLADNNLVLSPGGTYTAEWAIVPTGKPDYWTFINAARRLYDANFTVDGAFVFARRSPDGCGPTRKLPSSALKSAHYVCVHRVLQRRLLCPWHFFQQVAHEILNAFARWKGLVPGIKTLVYFHCFIDVTTRGRNGMPMRCCRPTARRPVTANPMTGYTCPRRKTVTVQRLPRTWISSRTRSAPTACTGTSMNTAGSPIPITSPDGCTGDIDPKSMSVSWLKSSVTLLNRTGGWPWPGTSWRGPLIGNGRSFTRAMAALKFPCFVETGSITHCVQAHLHTPIALGDHLTERSETDAYRVMLAALDFGCVYHWYNDLTVRPTHPHLVQYMYPITPVELHAGYIIGKERIITKTSGMFGCNDASTHEVHVFDDTGREVEGFDAPQLREDGVTWTELRIAEDWSAVIVKK